MPEPLTLSTRSFTVSVNGLAPVLKTMPFASVLAEKETPVVFEVRKVATSAAPLGTVVGAQVVAVFQSPLTGLSLHVALPAWLLCPLSNKTITARSPAVNVALKKRVSAPDLDVAGCFFMVGFWSLGAVFMALSLKLKS